MEDFVQVNELNGSFASNNSTSASDDMALVAGILSLFISAVSIVGNCLVISSVLSITGLKRSIFMKSKLSLAVSDLGYSFSIIFQIVYNFILSNDVTPSIRRQLWIIKISLNTFFFSASINILAIIALQRFYAIKEPIKYRNLSKTKQLICILLSWIPGFVYVAMTFFYSLLMDLRITFSIIAFCLFFVIPLSILFLCTIAMLIVFLCNQKNSTVNDIGVVCSRRDHRKIIMMTVLMVLGYVITFTPYMLSFFLFIMKGGLSVMQFEGDAFRVITETFLNFNCIVDILVYSIFDDSFREHFKEIYTKFFSNCSVK